MNVLNQCAIGVAASVITLTSGAVIHSTYELHKNPPPPSIETQLGSVVTVSLDDETCSGWVLKGSKQVITAAHCAPQNPTDPVMVDFGDGIQHTFHVEYIGDASWATSPDFMVLTTNDTAIKWPVGFGICKFPAYYGEKLNVFGAPLGLDKSIFFTQVTMPDRDFKARVQSQVPVDVIQGNIPLFPGQSGGPAVDANTGCVMGVSDFIVVDNQMNSSSFGVSYFEKASDLTKVLK